MYALGCAVLWASAVICFTKAGDRINPFRLNLFKNLVVSTLLIPTLLIFNGFSWPDFTTQQYGILILSGLIGITFADALYFMTLNYLGAGRTAIMNCLYAPGAMLFSFILFGEKLGGNGLIGFILILVGALLASLKDQYSHRDKRELKIGTICGIVTPLMVAFSIVIMKPVMEQQEALMPIIFTRVICGTLIQLGLLAFDGKLLKELKGLVQEQQPWGWMISGTVLGSFLAMLAWTSGFKYAEAALAAALNQTATIWIIVFAMFFLKERLSPRKVLGGILAFSGVLVISLL
jgi:drug/metabolite transporter (DMT)-like permease